MKLAAIALTIFAFACAIAMAAAPEPAKPKILNCAGQSYVAGPDPRAFCEQHFSAEGSCSGIDQLPIVETPWEKTAISIRGVTIAFLAGGISSGYVFAGNSYNHDVMAWLDPVHEGIVRQWFPAGLAFQFPGLAQESASARSRIDLHVRCGPKGASYEAYLILYYSMP